MRKAKDPLEQQISDWAAEKREPITDFKELAENLQNALAKSYVDYQDLEKDVKYFSQQNNVLDAQLEIKQRHIESLELDLAHIKAKKEGIFRDDDKEDRQDVNVFLQGR